MKLVKRVKPMISVAAMTGLLEAIRDAGADPDQVLRTFELEPSVLHESGCGEHQDWNRRSCPSLSEDRSHSGDRSDRHAAIPWRLDPAEREQLSEEPRGSRAGRSGGR